MLNNTWFKAIGTALVVTLLLTAASLSTPDSAELADADISEEDAALSDGTAAEGEEEEAESEEEWTFADPVVSLTLQINSAYHKNYISGYNDGTFRPDNKVSRAEASQMMYGLLSETYPDRLSFTDVSEDDWYYDAIGLLAAGGIIDFSGTRAGPHGLLSRAEFVSMLSRFFPDSRTYVCFYTDLDTEHEYYDDVAKATAYGWVSGYGDGSFHPDEPITRAEAVAIINRVIGRTPDKNYINSIILPLFSDCSADHWAYYEVMEASLNHTFESGDNVGETWTWINDEPLRRPAGFYFSGLDFYYIDAETGLPVTDTTIGSLYFGSDGRYTSGDEEIDGYVKDVLSSIITDDMTASEKLQAAYRYTRDSFTYLRRHYYEIGDTGWELEEARTMFSTKRGNCYCYASVFYYLSRQLGYDSQIISGVVGHSRSPHGWVEIDFDGVTYIFDTELEMAYRAKGVYYYNFYKMPYSAVPWPYAK